MSRKHPTVHLTAKQDFASYKRGDHIEDEAEVERILKGEHRPHVIKVAADVEKLQPVAEPETAPVTDKPAKPEKK